MAKLILLRHFKSQWNLENRFSGWVDVPLSKEGLEMVPEIGKKISEVKIDIAYCSPLIRNLDSMLQISPYLKGYPIFKHFQGKMAKWGHFEELNTDYIPVYVSEALNERYYGDLQGLNKEETIKKYGAKKVQLWRRGFNNGPPGGGEGLDEVYKRVAPFFKKNIERDLREEKNVLVVASHNSLRAIIKLVEKISDKDIINVEMPFGGLLEYEFNRGVYKKLN